MRLETDPTHYGFTNVTTPCLTTTFVRDPDHTFFWDTHHPTVFGHDFFAITMKLFWRSSGKPRLMKQPCWLGRKVSDGPTSNVADFSKSGLSRAATDPRGRAVAGFCPVNLQM